MPGTPQYEANFALVFSAQTLKPTEAEELKARRATDAIADTLRHLPSWSVDRVAQGGSFGKATCVRGSFDVDLVVFVNAPGDADITAEPERRRMLEAAADALLMRSNVCVEKVGDRRIKLAYDGLDMDVVLVENRWGQLAGGGGARVATAMSAQRAVLWQAAGAGLHAKLP
jgi:tRNA nucleotidyltransferase (CCA-adding enzyme)